MHHWIVEYDVFETREEKHRKQRDELNDRFIGVLIEIHTVVVQGVEIKKPTWFREASVDLDQMMTQLGGRRNR